MLLRSSRGFWIADSWAPVASMSGPMACVGALLLSWAFLASRSQELPGKWKCQPLSLVHATLWTVAYQTSPRDSPGKNTGGLLFPAPGHLPDPEAESESPICQADSLLSEPPRKPSSGLASSVAKYRSVFTPLGAKIREGEGRGAQGHHCLDLAHLNCR